MRVRRDEQQSSMRICRMLLIALLALPVFPLPASAASCDSAGLLPPPVSGPCPGIRPGALMTSPAGCTMNFVFRGATASDIYIGTASHCVGGVGSGVSLDGEGFIGQVAYTGWSEVNHEIDFALVKVAAGKLSRVNPSLCHWGGPTGVLVPTWPLVGVAYHYGHGIVTGSLTPTKGRIAAMKGWTDKIISFVGSVTFGDSGSALMTANGLAAGAIVAIAPNGDVATRIDLGMARASARMGVPLTLMTAPLA